MATITVRPDPQKFAVGASMAVYSSAAGWQPERATGPPPGTLVETQTVAAGGIATFTTLAYGTEYVGYGSSPDRYWRFEASSSTDALLSRVAAAETATTLVGSRLDRLPVNVGDSRTGYADVDITGATDATAAVQARLNASNHVYVPNGATVRCDTTLTVGAYRTLELAPGATIIRPTAATATTPVVRLNGTNYSRLIGHGTVQSQKNSPDGVVHVGPAVQTVTTDIQRWTVDGTLTILGANAGGTTNVGLNLTSSQVAAAVGSGSGSNYLGTVGPIDIRDVAIGVKEGELCNAHSFGAIRFHNISSVVWYLAGGTTGVSENTHHGGFTHTKYAGSNITVIKGERALFNEFYGVMAEPDLTGVPGSSYYNLDANSSQNRIFGFGNLQTNPLGVDSGTSNVILAQNTFQVAELVHNVPAARVYNNANQSLATGTQVTLLFNTERFDPGGAHSTVSNTSRLVAQRPGVYQINATVAITASAGGTVRQLLLQLNGATLIDIDREFGFTAANDCILRVSTMYKLALNDYVEVIVQQDSGGTLNALGSANYAPEFSFAYLGSGN